MWRSYNEDWERKKSYLIRSLFHDVPNLSSIPEESYESPSPAISPQDPLPPLIIEREPNRHDEPENYYKVLEIKIKRIYRKLFIEGRDLSDDDFLTDSDIASGDSTMEDDTNDVGINDVNESQVNLDTYCTEIDTENGDTICEHKTEDITDDDNSKIQESDYIDEENLPEDLESMEKTPTELGAQALDSFEDKSGIDYRQITTEAIVHIDGTEDTEEQSLVYEDSIRSVILCQTRPKPRGLDVARVNDACSEDVATTLLEKCIEPENVEEHGPELIDSMEDVEVMRTPHPEFSADSIAHTRVNDVTSNSDVTIKGSMTSDSDVSRDTDESDISKDQEYNVEADISGGFDANFDSLNISKCISEAVSCRKRRLEVDAGTQTAKKVHWDDIKSNFFIGAPKIFRLCSCIDHVCIS